MNEITGLANGAAPATTAATTENTAWPSAGHAARQAGAGWLAAALQASRQDTLATFASCARGLVKLQVPQCSTLNPPLWELGHIGWFQDHWLGRNPQRKAGAAADPDAPRGPAARVLADALYDSSKVAHASRWSLALPDVASTQADLAAQLAHTLALLQAADTTDDALYFFRLALLHEDMHHEAALYMAHSLGLAIDDGRWQAQPLPDTRQTLQLPAGGWTLGNSDCGFAFDNELSAHQVALPACQIDSQVLRWADYLPFVEAGGYSQPQWWADEARAWLAAGQPRCPRYTRRVGSPAPHWQRWQQGQWQALDLGLPACHLTAFEADAWCRWAGRRLPTEAEWERAAVSLQASPQTDQQTSPPAFHWGQVWEWTASPFVPYPGFRPHPYRDYSAPWFGGHRVLRGASHLTQPRLRHPRYRNFFVPQRNDVPAGFRSCSL